MQTIMTDVRGIRLYPGDIVTSSHGTTGIFIKFEDGSAHLNIEGSAAICFTKSDGTPPDLTLLKRGLEGRISDMTKDQFNAALAKIGNEIDTAQARNKIRRAAFAGSPQITL